MKWDGTGWDGMELRGSQSQYPGLCEFFFCYTVVLILWIRLFFFYQSFALFFISCSTRGFDVERASERAMRCVKRIGISKGGGLFLKEETQERLFGLVLVWRAGFFHKDGWDGMELAEVFVF